MSRKSEASDDTFSQASHESQDQYEPIVVESTPYSTELKPSVKKALLQLRCNLQDAILGNQIYRGPSTSGSRGSSRGNISEDDFEVKEDIRDISLWGVPLLPSKGHEGTDIILLKFLQAKDYKVNDAFELLRKVLKWRKEFETDATLEETHNPEFESMGYFDGRDRKGQPVGFIKYGDIKDLELADKVFESEEKIIEFLRWRVKVMEKGIQMLNFKEGGANSIVQITDLTNMSPSPSVMKGMRTAAKRAYSILNENYPEFIYKNIFVNVPFWYYAYHSVSMALQPQRVKSKYIFARPARATKTLLKYISAENLPVQYGGLKRENDNDFSPEYRTLETIVKPGCIDSIQVPIQEPGVTVVWDLTVVGLDVSYKEEFVPDDDCSYRIVIQMEKKLSGSVRNSFYINEPGKILLTIDNSTFKNKKVLYRLKIKPTSPMFVYMK